MLVTGLLPLFCSDSSHVPRGPPAQGGSAHSGMAASTLIKKMPVDLPVGQYDENVS